MSALFSLLLFFICLSGLIILVFGVALLVWLRRVARSVSHAATANQPADDAIEVDYVLLEQDGVSETSPDSPIEGSTQRRESAEKKRGRFNAP